MYEQRERERERERESRSHVASSHEDLYSECSRRRRLLYAVGAVGLLLGIYLMGCESSDSLPTPTLSATEASIDVGKGQLSGQKSLSITVTAPSGTTATVQGVTRGGSAVTSPRFTIKNGTLTLGSDGTYDAAAGSYRVAIGCSGCTKATATVVIRNAIALYDIGQRGANFGWNECATFITGGSGGVVAKLKADGYTASGDSVATFFGSKVPVASNGYHFYKDGDSNQLYNSANGLNLSSGEENRQVIAYTANKIAPSGLSIKQLVRTEVSSDVGIWSNSRARSAIAEFLGSANISGDNVSDTFWSFSQASGQASPSTGSCNASGSGNTNRTVSSALTGNVGSIRGVATGGPVCNVSGTNRPHVLCVVK